MKIFVDRKFTAASASEMADNAKQLNDGLKFQEALEKYLEAIKTDYQKWDGSNPDETQSKMAKEFEENLHIVETQLYYRVHSKTSVHSFIVKEDGPKFKRGDILKAASWNAPAKNQARGNIFGTYRVRWTGAEYL